ncbi:MULTISPECIES: ATP-binding protein [unclassified Pseudonocardia]|uniref:AAA family ATPase n=1 Tax=unclassified Pseudonocardia TaxID=2619320 RepID=UPI00094B4E89|nr:ATP-binding protein [Pseudonocardia sp. Ae707_Ps1]OLM18857.1 regulatory protein, LuxR [Pseudonocardia sp. Ae707_Ps1]
MNERLLRERDAECTALDRALDALVAGSSPFVAVTGEPGTGRSALLRRATGRATARDVRVLTARAVPAESGYPLGVAHGLVGGLDPAPALPRSGPVGAGLLHEWCRAVLDAARTGPVLLVVDDLHWADDESRQWLQMLLRRRSEAPIGLLVALNGTHDGLGWATAPTAPSDVVLRTGPLSADAVRAVVTTEYGMLPDRVFAVLARRTTGGNPAVLAATLARLDRSESPTAAAVPELVRCAATARRDHVAGVLDGLPAALVDALRAAAVCGTELAPVRERIGGTGPSTGGGTRAALAATGLVRGTDPELPADGTVTDAVLAGIDPERRRALFASAAGLAARAGLPEDRIARALLAAPALGEPWAAELLHRVATRHRAGNRHADAADVAERALQEPVPEQLRGALMVELALSRAHSAPGTAARVLARITLDTDLAASTHGARAVDLLLSDGEVGAARRALNIAVRRCPEDAPTREDLLSLSRLTDELGFEERAALRGPVGTAVAESDDGGPVARGTTAWALVLRCQDRDRATRLARAALAGPVGAAPAMPQVMAALTLDAAGCRGEAVDTMHHLLLEITRDRPVPPAVLAVSALVGLRAGDLDGARRDLRAAGDAPVSSDGADPLAGAARVLLHLAESDHAAAAAAAFAHPVAGRERPGSALLEYARGRVRAAEGRHREAIEMFMGCGRLLLDRGRVNPVLAQWRSAAATSLQACGTHAAARRMADDEHRLAVRWGAPGPIAVAEAALAGLDGDPTGTGGPERDGVRRAVRP